MPTDNVSKKRGKAKVKISVKREAAMQKVMDSYSEDFDVKMSVIQELIPLGLKALAEELTSEVKRLAGERYSRGGDNARGAAKMGRYICVIKNFRCAYHAFAMWPLKKRSLYKHTNVYKSHPTTRKLCVGYCMA